ncbi:hypothetical protein BASA81_004848 [Batrachochytrium salamandrivorans]|nr:hypothetical protein BASA81_004848 [Batrachochytrium salamandrivorans]
MAEALEHSSLLGGEEGEEPPQPPVVVDSSFSKSRQLVPLPLPPPADHPRFVTPIKPLSILPPPLTSTNPFQTNSSYSQPRFFQVQDGDEEHEIGDGEEDSGEEEKSHPPDVTVISPRPQSALPPPYRKDFPLQRAVSHDCITRTSPPLLQSAHHHQVKSLHSPARLSFDSLPPDGLTSPQAAFSSTRSSLLQLTPSAKKQQSMMLTQIRQLQTELTAEKHAVQEMKRQVSELHAQRFGLAMALALFVPGLGCMQIQHWLEEEGSQREGEEDSGLAGVMIFGAALLLVGCGMALWNRAKAILYKWERSASSSFAHASSGDEEEKPLHGAVHTNLRRRIHL